eukprot:3554020-Pyramimonas_sp.AAC.2
MAAASIITSLGKPAPRARRRPLRAPRRRPPDAPTRSLTSDRPPRRAKRAFNCGWGLRCCSRA